MEKDSDSHYSLHSLALHPLTTEEIAREVLNKAPALIYDYSLNRDFNSVTNEFHKVFLTKCNERNTSNYIKKSIFSKGQLVSYSDRLTALSLINTEIENLKSGTLSPLATHHFLENKNITIKDIKEYYPYLNNLNSQDILNSLREKEERNSELESKLSITVQKPFNYKMSSKDKIEFEKMKDLPAPIMSSMRNPWNQSMGKYFSIKKNYLELYYEIDQLKLNNAPYS